MIYTNRTMIVPAAYQVLAQNLCAAMAEGDAGANMFIRALGPTPEAEPTHYISAGPIDEQFANILPLTTVEWDYSGEVPTSTVTKTLGQPEQVVTIATSVGIEISLEIIQSLFAAIDISEQPPMEAMARLGLVFTQPPEDAA